MSRHLLLALFTLPLSLQTGCAVVSAGVAVGSVAVTAGSVAVSTVAAVGTAAVKGTVKAGELVVDAVTDDESEKDADRKR